MQNSVTISKQPPTQKSMQYSFLTAEGIRHIQTLSGNLWTDYNVQEPGVTILEALCYALTDLGYRSSYSIKDILALDPDDKNAKDIKNFYTARQIFPNVALTLNDYRKLLIDVNGVKNAWIELAQETEVQIYVNKIKSFLTYDNSSEVEPLALKQLYNILLEFEAYDEPIGDLNSNTVSKELLITKDICAALDGLVIKITVEFPKWDDTNTIWSDDNSIITNIRSIELFYENLPDGFTIEDHIDPDTKTVVLSGTMPVPAGIDIIPDIGNVAAKINDTLYTGNDSLLSIYKQKIAIIRSVLKEVSRTLNANRNLGDDFYKISALKVEEIVICSSIDLERDANVEKVEAEILYRIANFLSPTVYIYSLDELVKQDPTITEVFEGDSAAADAAAQTNPLLLKERAMDEIFEGPALNHGFILDEELEAAQRKSVLHVSDLIHIIMEVPGVVAVKEIQIANIFEAAEDGLISQTVRWCLELAVENNYVPRLNIDKSKITYYKDNLPYRANNVQVEEEIKALKAGERKQKPLHPVLDLKVPEGEYKELEDYVSVQNEFPDTYGVGEAGLPESVTSLRKAQAKQLKGYLMPFDQLMADFLSQLSHVKDLFSMSGEKDENGDYVIGHTYYTQSLLNIVPNGLELFTDPYRYPTDLEKIAESEKVFTDRRNRFLDHLMARFAEQFTDYTLLVYGLDGPKAPRELIEDKLRFLASYPAISSGRGKGFDYKDQEYLWHINNHAGLEDRAALLGGVDNKPSEKTLHFTSTVDIVKAGNSYHFVIQDAASSTKYLQSDNFQTEEECKAVAERALILGLFDTSYRVDVNGSNYTLTLLSNSGEMASGLVTYASEQDARNAIADIIKVISKEFFYNEEANRNNLAPAIDNYFETSLTVDMLSNPPKYTITINLYSSPFDRSAGAKVLTHTFTGEGDPKSSLVITNMYKADRKIVARGEETRLLLPGDPIVVGDSTANVNYTVASFQIVGEDIIIVVNESLDSWSANPDYVLYNSQTEDELKKWGEDKTKEIIWSIITSSISSKRYSLGFEKIDPSDISSPEAYFFFLTDRFCERIGRSYVYNFNNELAGEINDNIAGAVITVELLYLQKQLKVVSVTPRISEVEIQVADPLPAFKEGSDVSFSLRIDNIVCNANKNVISVSGDYSQKIFPGEVITITDIRNAGEYSVRSVISDGTSTEINVIEGVAANSSGGSLTYTRTFPVDSFSGTDTLLIKSGPDEESVAADLRKAVDGQIDITGEVQVPVVSAKANGPEVELTLGGVFSGTSAGESLALIFSYDKNRFLVDPASKTISVKDDLRRKVEKGDTVKISGDTVNKGEYTVKKVEFDGMFTIFTIKEILPSLEQKGTFSFTRSFRILSKALPSKITIRGEYDEQAIDDFIAFMNETFMSREGMHIVEHILLRPKNNGYVLSQEEVKLQSGLGSNGAILYNKVFDIIPLTSDTFRVEGTAPADLPSEIAVGMSGDPLKDTHYQINYYYYRPENNDTVYSVSPPFSEEESRQKRYMSYQVSAAVTSVSSADKAFFTDADAGSGIKLNSFIEVQGSTGGVNDGHYKVTALEDTEAGRKITVVKAVFVQDKLWPVNLKTGSGAACDSCLIEDPYSFVVSVILPYWPGRFSNRNFRTFFEQTIRQEAPAHLFFTICWIGPDQMRDFELKYKTWLVENAKDVPDVVKVSAALADLIDIIAQLKNVYPTGTLHDCDTDDTLENAIILDNSILGNA